jgi:hypothetical protein
VTTLNPLFYSLFLSSSSSTSQQLSVEFLMLSSYIDTMYFDIIHPLFLLLLPLNSPTITVI